MSFFLLSSSYICFFLLISCSYHFSFFYSHFIYFLTALSLVSWLSSPIFLKKSMSCFISSRLMRVIYSKSSFSVCSLFSYFGLAPVGLPVWHSLVISSAEIMKILAIKGSIVVSTSFTLACSCGYILGIKMSTVACLSRSFTIFTLTLPYFSKNLISSLSLIKFCLRGFISS